MSQFLDLLSFSKNYWYLARNCSLANFQQFKWRPSFQRYSFFIFGWSIKSKFWARHLSFRVSFTALIKGNLRPVFIIKLKINIPFTTKAAYSLAIFMMLSARSRSLITLEFMMSLVPICKTVISLIKFVLFKFG